MRVKKGFLIRDKRNDQMYVITTNLYTKRFLDDKDHNMISAGYGEWAGTYMSAFDAINSMTGRKKTFKYGKGYMIISGENDVKIQSRLA